MKFSKVTWGDGYHEVQQGDLGQVIDTKLCNKRRFESLSFNTIRLKFSRKILKSSKHSTRVFIIG